MCFEVNVTLATTKKLSSLFAPVTSAPFSQWWSVVDAEILVLPAEDPKLSQAPPSELGVDQNIALHPHLLLGVLPLKRLLFIPLILFQHKVMSLSNSEQDIQLELYTQSCTLFSPDTLCLQNPCTRCCGSCRFSILSPSTRNDLPLPLRKNTHHPCWSPWNLPSFLFQTLETCSVFPSCAAIFLRCKPLLYLFKSFVNFVQCTRVCGCPCVCALREVLSEQHFAHYIYKYFNYYYYSIATWWILHHPTLSLLFTYDLIHFASPYCNLHGCLGAKCSVLVSPPLLVASTGTNNA